jgi:hypothetical protein
MASFGKYKDKLYLCQKMNLKIEFSMALEIRSIPVLTGEDAERFVHEAEENERNSSKEEIAFLL